MKNYEERNGVIIWHPEKSVILTDKIGEGTVIHAPVWIGKDVPIGRNCKVQAFAFIPAWVHISDEVFIGPHVCFTNDKHPPSGGKAWSHTFVGKGVVIGANATILPGINLNPRCIIGAGAVVTKDVPGGVTVVGNPARPMKG